MSTVTGINLLQGILVGQGVTLLPSQQSDLENALQALIDSGQDTAFALADMLSVNPQISGSLAEGDSLALIIKDAVEVIEEDGEPTGPITFTLAPSALEIHEGEANTFTVEASRAVDVDTVVTFQLSVTEPGDSAQLDDFISGSFNAKPVTIIAGETTATFDYTALNDGVPELSEKYTVIATVDGEVIDSKQVTILDGPAGGGQIFTLTTGIDDGPDYTGGAGDDTFKAIIDDDGTTNNSTLTPLDSIDGAGGTADKLQLNALTAVTAFPTVDIQNINILELKAADAFAADVSDLGFDDVNVIYNAGDLDLTAGADTAFNVSHSGASATTTLTGGSTQTVNVGYGDVTLTKAADAISVTHTAQVDDITIEDGTDVTVVATAKAASGDITIGATDAATGAVSVTQNLNSAAATFAGGDIKVTGGTTVDVTVNGTITATKDLDTGTLTAGKVTVTSDGNTTDVNIVQNLTDNDYSKDAIADIAATEVVTFKALAKDATVTVDGLTFTAAKALTAAEVAAAFSNLDEEGAAGSITSFGGDIVSAGGPVVNGVFTGSTNGVWTSGPANGATVDFSAPATTGTFAGTLASSVPASKPTNAFVAGTDNSGTAESGDVSVTYSAVTIEDDATTASIENITVDGYAVSTIGDTNNVDALETLFLANSAGSMTVTTAAEALSLNVDNVDNDVTLTATSLTDLTLNAEGANSAFKLESANTTDLTINAAADLDLDATSDLTAAKNITVAGAGAVDLGGFTPGTLTTLNAATNTGGVFAAVNGTTKVTGGDGNDFIIVLDTAITKAIDLGKGNDYLGISAVTAIGDVGAVTIDGGAGTDVLAMNSAAAAGANAAFAAKFVNFEILEIADQVALAANVTVDLGVLKYDHVVTNGTTGNFSLILDKMATGGTVEFKGSQDATSTGIQVNVLDADTNATDSLNFTIAADAGLVVAEEVETINVIGEGSITLESAALTTVKVDGSNVATFDVNGNPLTYEDISVILDTDSINVALVDASASKGAFTFDSLEESVVATVIKGGSGNDEISVSGANDEVYAGAGNDYIYISDTASAAKVHGGAGNDLFDITGATLGLEAYATILDFSAGDQIQINAATFKSQGVVVTDPSEMGLTDWFTAAFNQTDAGQAIWFQHNNNTYIVDNAITEDFIATDDVVVKLTGLIDLDTASFNADFNIIEMA
jgi:S-layer protein